MEFGIAIKAAEIMDTYFLHQIKYNKTTGKWDKGIVVKDAEGEDNLAAARQSYHAYLGAYAYGQSTEIVYVSCKITNIYGAVVEEETWIAKEEEK